MASRKLTARFCEGERGESGKQVAFPDADVRGLEFRISASGRKSWSLRYRNADGRQCRVSLGGFPERDLERARRKARGLLTAVDDGGDPAKDKRVARARAATAAVETFADLMTDYSDACERGYWKPRGKKKRATTLAAERANYRLHLEKQLGPRPLDEITRAVVKARLRQIAATAPVLANRVQALIRSAFSYCIAEEIAPESVSANPAAGFAPLGEETPRQRILSDDELRALWGALKDPSGLKVEGKPIQVGRAMRIAVQLCLLTLQRKSEVVGMRADELRLDEGVWLLPPERVKGGRAHAVALTPAAVVLIREAITLATPKDSKEPAPEWVFPSRLRSLGPIRPRSLSHAMTDLTTALGIPDATPQDLRRTGSSALTSERIGVSQFVRSQVLGHASDSGGGASVSRAHYDVNNYMVEKRRAVVAWEGLLFRIVGETPRADNVTPLRGAAS